MDKNKSNLTTGNLRLETYRLAPTQGSLMGSIQKRIQRYGKPLVEALEKWRWLILTVIGLSLLWVEIQEFLVLRILNQAFHYFEAFQYAVLIFSTGLLIELFSRSNRAHKQAVKILEYKHRLSLELTSNDDWESLIQKITELPGRIAEVDESYLLASDPISGKFDSIGHWALEGSPAKPTTWDPTVACKKCFEKSLNGRSTFHLCRSEEDDGSSGYAYSLGLRGPNFPTTILKFKVKPGLMLSRDEESIFESIGDEIVVALQSSQDRKRLSEMQSAQVAMAERRVVSAYVHDQLGQNLGFMHLKLDQLSANENIKRLKGVRTELTRLRDVANESYEIVRDILKKIQPETVPHLTNLLQEHARTVSRRAKIELDFKSMGNPVHLPPNTQQLIFFAFREILSNVERHADANKLDVLVTWSDNFLDVSVADDGKGFDPVTVQRDEHFGLEIMQERIANIKGKFTIHSSTDSGTVVSISVPLEWGKAGPV